MATKNVRLKDGNDVLYNEANGGGIDTSNVLASGGIGGGGGYTATQDCYIFLVATYNYGYSGLAIDGVTIIGDSNQHSNYGRLMVGLFLKKGQALTIIQSSGVSRHFDYVAYGIKHN